MGELRRFLSSQLVGVCAGFKGNKVVAAVAAVTLGSDDSLKLAFPKRNPFLAGEKVTVHLDDRTGSEVFSVEQRVHRVSYRGRLVASAGAEAFLVPEDFELVYGSRTAARYRSPDFIPAEDHRRPHPLADSPLTATALTDENERSNKLGVLITRSVDRPHTTVMAFLNSQNDDIFLITKRDTYKYHNLEKDPSCVFALDHRASFLFERQVEWNYTIFEAKARRVPREQPLFQVVQAEFVAKNPWEEPFFSDPQAEMLHLVPQRIVYQDILCD